MNRPPLRTILYVEDNPNIRALARIAIERIGGFTLHACESGAEALAAIEGGLRPDLLLLDVMLPGMDGTTILEHLRRLPQTAGTPVIFMTAKAQTSEIAHFMSLGALGVITKPFQPTLLPKEIERLWNTGAANAAADDGIEDALDKFRARFIAGLPKQLGELQKLAQQMTTATGIEALHPAHRVLHVISGTAGTFGFEELGDRARAVEQMMHRAIDSGNGTDMLHAIAGAVDAFLQWSDAAMKSGVPEAASYPAPSPGPAQVPQLHSRTHESNLVYLLNTAAADNDLANQLVHFGYEVTVIDKLGKLADAVKARMPSSIVIDTDSQADILAACEQIAATRAAFGASMCPAIVVSSHGDFATRLAAARSGVQSYLLKPVDAGALAELLAEPDVAGSDQPYRILIVDDDEATAAYYKTILNNAQIEAAVLTQPERIFQTLEKYRPELIVMDLYMPECSGSDLAALIRQDKSFLDIPIIFLSNEHNLDRQTEAIQSGADYFLTKPITPERLVSTLTSRAQRYRSLRGLIMRDGLTGLFNHTAMKEHLQREIMRARRGNLPLSIAMIDLDHFKKVNDACGHPAGDQVIRSLARLMQQRFRRSDLVGRYGGEEFIVILPATSSIAARGMLDDVRQAFSQILHRYGEKEFTVTFSAGVAELGADDNCDSLIQTADTMLYRAKGGGRNRVEAG
jgi:diguanylate cyclase (GGDEF)-like protein